MGDPRSRADFLNGMSYVATGVHIVTTDGPAGWAGVTVTAMTAVSADAAMPTLLVCIHEQSAAAAAIVANQSFCVNVLRHEQAHISDAFAGRFKAPERDKFVSGAWTTTPTGAPRLTDALAAFDCALAAHHKVGSHLVMLGAVGDTFIGEPGSNLLYFRRGYHAPTRLDSRPSDELELAAESRTQDPQDGPIGWLRRAMGRR